MVYSKIQKWFFDSVVVILILTAAAKIYSAFGSAGILRELDPLILVSNKVILISAAAIEVIVAAALLSVKSRILKSATVLWLGACFAIYRVGRYFLGNIWHCPCLGYITQKLPVNREVIDKILTFILIYMIAGSVCFLLQKGGEKGMRKKRSTSAAIES